MKILLVHNYYSQRGGEDIYFDNLAKLLKKKGHQIFLFTKKSSKVVGLRDKISALRSLFFVNREINKELDDYIKKVRPQIVHFNNINPLIGPAAYEVCHKNNLPVIQTIHNYRLLPHKELSLGYDNYRSKVYKYIFRLSVRLVLYKKLLERVSCFIFPSKESLKIYKENAQFRVNNYVVIPNFVDDQVGLKRITRSDYFLFAGRFSKEKGVLPLLEIFAGLPNLKLAVIGDGPELKDVQKYKNHKNIKIIGWTDRKTLYRYIKRAVAVISPSLSHEVMPLNIIESLVLKTPVIVPKKETFEEIIKNPSDATFFNDHDFEGLKNKIANYDYSKMVKTNYSMYYSSKKHYSKIIEIYKKTLIIK